MRCCVLHEVHVSNLSICLGIYQVNIFLQTNYETKAVDKHQERNNTRKLTISVISECRHCLYPVYSQKRCGVLQKLLLGKVELRLHTR